MLKILCSKRWSDRFSSFDHLVGGGEQRLRHVEADKKPAAPRETRLRGWACEIRTQKRRRKLSL